jgi:hypothetical protein
LLKILSAAGFKDAEIVKKHDIFADVPNPSSVLESRVRKGSDKILISAQLIGAITGPTVGTKMGFESISKKRR